jgi:phage-related minor tail protein
MKVLEMDEEIERLVVSVRADTSAFARDVASMRGELEGPLVTGAGRAGMMIDNALARAMRTGKLGFDDLKRVALSAMAEIAQASLRGLFSPSHGGTPIGASLINGLGSIVSGLFGLPGRATGGPVSAGRGYVVGERGPELFVPSSSGRIEHVRQGARDVRVSIAVQTPSASDPQVLRQSSRQVARAIRSALAERR